MRSQIRLAIDQLAMVLITPLMALYRLRLMAYDTGGLILAQIPGQPGIFLRRAWYRLTLASCGSELIIQFGSVLCDPRAEVGDGCYIGYSCRVAYADIGDAVLLADHVSVLSGMDHYGIARRDIPMRDQPGVHRKITIGEDVWIGDTAVVGADVAPHSIVGSSAVVTRTFEAWDVLAGVPARQIGVRPEAPPAVALSDSVDRTADVGTVSVSGQNAAVRDEADGKLAPMRDSLTRWLDAVALVLASPFIGLYRAGAMGYDTGGTLLSLLPGNVGVFVRRAWYRNTLQSCGERLNVQFAGVISSPLAEVGDDCFIGHFTRVGLASLGSDVMIAEHCSILSGGGHYGFMRRDVPMRLQPGAHTRITIGDDVWIGASVVISADLAAHSVVASAAAVNRTFEEWQILAGVPAEVVATRPAARRRRNRANAAVKAAEATPTVTVTPVPEPDAVLGTATEAPAPSASGIPTETTSAETPTAERSRG